jgi:hypothetical protein
LTDIGPLTGISTPEEARANHVDAAKVEADGTVVSVRIRDVGLPAMHPGSVLPGDLVQKSGRTTGLTFGQVSAVNFDASSGPYTCALYSAAFFDQIYVRFCRDFDDCESPFDEFSAFALGGDSGAALLDLNDPPQVVGLVFANEGVGRHAVANPIDQVLNALDLDLSLGKCLCPIEALVAGARDSADVVSFLRRFRLEVLQRTPRGREYTRLFERFKGEAALLLLRNTGLAERSRTTLERIKPVLGNLVERHEASISRADLEQVERLIAEYATAGTRELREALTRFKRDLRNRKALAQFGWAVAR